MTNKEFEEWLESVNEKIRDKLKRDGYVTPFELRDFIKGGSGDCYRIPDADLYGWTYIAGQNNTEVAL